MNCIAPGGICPCADCGNSCYLRECVSPRKVSPNGKDTPLAVRPAFVGALVLAVLLFVGTFGFADALLADAEEKEARVQRILNPSVEEVARKYASIIVACANGQGFSVGDILVFCDPHHSPMAKRMEGTP